MPALFAREVVGWGLTEQQPLGRGVLQCALKQLALHDRCVGEWGVGGVSPCLPHIRTPPSYPSTTSLSITIVEVVFEISKLCTGPQWDVEISPVALR